MQYSTYSTLERLWAVRNEANDLGLADVIAAVDVAIEAAKKPKHTINESHRRVGGDICGPSVAFRAVESTTTAGKFYAVAVVESPSMQDVPISCTCPDFAFRGARSGNRASHADTYCEHMRASAG